MSEELQAAIAEVSANTFVVKALVENALRTEQNLMRVVVMREMFVQGDESMATIIAKNLCDSITNDIHEHARNLVGIRSAKKA